MTIIAVSMANVFQAETKVKADQQLSETGTVSIYETFDFMNDIA